MEEALRAAEVAMQDMYSAGVEDFEGDILDMVFGEYPQIFEY